jgi:hypothetical protein
MLAVADDLLLVFRYPVLLLVVAFFVLWLAAWIGAKRFHGLRQYVDDHREDFGVVQSATLTLLALIIGFTFSMAVGRYDQRKNYEEEEANAIGTEYLRADFLSAAEAAKVRQLLRSYLDQRILFYTTRDREGLARIDAKTAELQAELWAAVRAPVAAQATPVMALVASGMNDVLNTQGYTQAAWLNRIPAAAWALMSVIAVGCTLLVGIGAKSPVNARVLVILPLTVAVAFFLIADIDSPRQGVIQIAPQNLHSLAHSLAPR